ncbi:IS5 family transposase [Haloarcula quadrata]|uniref:IS5 family transposase n=1 Tax=Haloarcula quadrata TaxID=182779 RepID=A0A495QW39_9EURY|nr:IS5-like element ISHma10 family transposase [Haloarcula quadrata]RKS78310.1 IS5 family transposase [Haloarcula quadrata]
MKRESNVMHNTLFRFVKQVASLAQKLTDAALMELSDPAGNGFAGWKHAVLLYLREHMSAEYEEIIDWAEEMERVRAVLNLQRGEFPAPSTLCKAFKRASMTVWRQLLRRSAELLDQNGHAAIDATYFDRQQASSHYLRRIDRSVKTIQTTFLVDTAEGAVLDLHCSTEWPDETKIGPKVALRNAGDLRSLAADKGYDDMSFREELRNAGIRPLIKHRVFAPYDHAHNARIDDELYGQRSQTESVNSSIKRSHGSAVRARDWFRQFREITLIAGVYNVEQAIER